MTSQIFFYLDFLRGSLLLGIVFSIDILDVAASRIYIFERQSISEIIYGL